MHKLYFMKAAGQEAMRKRRDFDEVRRLCLKMQLGTAAQGIAGAKMSGYARSMRYHLAQINIAKFRVPIDDPVNADFVASLDRVNAIAERQEGFVWRLVGDGNDATDIRAFGDPNVIVNLSVWTDIEALGNFVYRAPAHRDIMRRRREWFERLDFFTVLWWIPAGHRPSVGEGLERLDRLTRLGPTPDAFLFTRSFGPPGQATPDPVLDQCA